MRANIPGQSLQGAEQLREFLSVWLPSVHPHSLSQESNEPPNHAQSSHT